MSGDFRALRNRAAEISAADDAIQGNSPWDLPDDGSRGAARALEELADLMEAGQ